MRILFVLLMTAGASESALAYIDLGTGSLLLQGLLAALVGALAGIKFY